MPSKIMIPNETGGFQSMITDRKKEENDFSNIKQKQFINIFSKMNTSFSF